jgi:hypothetical protein
VTRDPEISAEPLYLLPHFSLLKKRCRNGCGLRKTKKYVFYEDSIDANLPFYVLDLIRDKITSHNYLIFCEICTVLVKIANGNADGTVY